MCSMLWARKSGFGSTKWDLTTIHKRHTITITSHSAPLRMIRNQPTNGEDWGKFWEGMNS